MRDVGAVSINFCVQLSPWSALSLISHFSPLRNILQCDTATRCPNGDECADDEFCYIDFLCDPQQIPINNTTSSTAASDLPPATNDSISTSNINSQGNGCELCGASIDGPLYHIRRNVTVDLYGDEISCVDLATRIILMFGPASDQCLEILGTHSTDCWCVISLRDFYSTSFLCA